MTDRVSIGLLIALPLMVTMGVSVHQSHAAALVVAVAVILSLEVLVGAGVADPRRFVRLRPSFGSTCLSALGLYAAAWLAFIYSWGFLGGDPGTVFVNTDALTCLILGAVFFLAVLRSEAEDAFIHDIICISALIQAVLGLLQWYDLDPVHRLMAMVVTPRGDLPWNTPVGTLGNQNWLGAYLSISLPFFARPRWYAAGLPVVVCLLLTSTTPILAAIVGAGYLYAGWAGVALTTVPAAIFIGFFGLEHLSPRLGLWAAGLKSSFSSWHTAVVGWGPGISWAPDNHLHNQYLQTLFNYGLVGLGLVLGYIVSCLRSSRMLTACVIIVAVNMAGNSPLNVVPCALLVLTVMALIERNRRTEQWQILEP